MFEAKETLSDEHGGNRRQPFLCVQWHGGSKMIGSRRERTDLARGGGILERKSVPWGGWQRQSQQHFVKRQVEGLEIVERMLIQRGG